MGNYYEAPVNCPGSSVIKRFALVDHSAGPEVTPRDGYCDLVFWIGRCKYYYDTRLNVDVFFLYDKLKRAPSKGRAYNELIKKEYDYYLRAPGF